jgi:hypothetical protein
MRLGHTIIGVVLTLTAPACSRGADQPTKTDARAAPLALETNCQHAGSQRDGTVQFIPTCPERAVRPDKRWTLVQTEAVGKAETYRVYIADQLGKSIGDVSGLSDYMPFMLYWSPRPNWFAVSHHVGSFLDQPEVYEITPLGPIRRDAFRMKASDEIRRRYPCLGSGVDWLQGGIIRWSPDGRRIAWFFTTSLYACGPDRPDAFNSGPGWESLMLVSDAETGEIVPESIRLLSDKDFPELRLPNDGPYAEF